MKTYSFFLLFLFLFTVSVSAHRFGGTMVSGRIISTEKEIVDFATVHLKGTNYGGITNQEGLYHVAAPAGNYLLVVLAIKL